MAYSSDITIEEYNLIKQLIENKKITKPRKIAYIDILNAIFYQNKNGCTWRDLPKDYPKWQTVYYYFNKWKIEGLIERVLEKLMTDERTRLGKKYLAFSRNSRFSSS
jgi:transposase